MKEIKYVLSIIFFVVIMIFTNEMYVWNIDSFDTEYIATTMYPKADTSQEEMLGEIEETALQNNLLVFAVTRNVKTLYSEDISIYCMEGAEDVLASESSMKAGSYQSLFIGNLTVNIEKFSNIRDVNEIDTYYLIGDMEDARNFKSMLIDKYSGNFPKEGYTSLHVNRNILSVWSISILFFLLLTLFETILIKKELTVCFIYGESLYQIIGKKIVNNLIFYAGSYTILFFALKYIFHLNVDYHLKDSVLCVGVFCLFNTLLYLRLLYLDYRTALRHGKYSKTALNTSYIFKVFSMAVLTIAVSACVGMLAKGANYWKQNDFFENFRDYSYISLSANDNELEKSEQLALSLLNDKSKEKKAFLNVYLDNGIFTGKPCLLFNETSLDYLKTKIPDLMNMELEHKIYYIVPDSETDMGIQDLDFLTSMYMGEDIKKEIISYKGKASVLGISNQGAITSDFYSNPLIILNLSDNNNYFNGIYISQACLYKIGQSEWEQYIEQEDIYENVSFITNAWDNYQYQLKLNKRLMLLGGTVFILLLILEIILIRTIMYYECTLNIMELAIKTTLGYTIFEKYKKMFLTTYSSEIFVVCICSVVAVLFNLASLKDLLLGYFVITVIDLLFMIYFIRRMEKSCVQKTMKGALL